MPNVTFQAQTFELAPGESVLDGLLRHGQDIPHGCRGGACQSCALKVTEGEVPAKAQVGLKDAQKQLGLFLSCSCVPQGDLTVTTTNAVNPKVQAQVIERKKLSNQVLRLRLRADLPFMAGQYLNIWLDHQHLRSYSIASLPEDGFIELHIKLIPGGRFSDWADRHLQLGDFLTIQGPLGACIYTPEAEDRPLLLIGCGTGLAPLFGIAQAASAHGQKSHIHLVIAGRTPESFYLHDELQQLQAESSDLKVTYVCQTAAAEIPGAVQGDVYTFVKQHYPNTRGMRIYLCGGESFVRKLRKQCFLSGAAMKDIHADAFLPCK